MKKISLFAIVLLLILGCQNTKKIPLAEENTVKEDVKTVSDTLYILASDDFFSSGLVDSLANSFLKESQTILIWENGGSKKELINKLAESTFYNYPDLVLGLSNVFLTELDSLNIFQKLDDIFFSNVRSNNRFDKQKRFLPYQYNYLALIKKSSNKLAFPNSFGALQKEEYFNKLVISDAINTEIGRALFNNIEGIFKFHGYAACWSRIKGSLFAITDTESEAFDIFWEQEDKFLVQAVTKVIEGYETGYPPTMQFAYLSEGSYKIINSLAITNRCRNQHKAEVFLLWLHKAETQSMIVKTTNWYPIIEIATKSLGHRIIDYPKATMNNKIDQRVVAKYLSDWLDYWKIYKESYYGK